MTLLNLKFLRLSDFEYIVGTTDGRTDVWTAERKDCPEEGHILNSMLLVCFYIQTSRLFPLLLINLFACHFSSLTYSAVVLMWI